MKFTAVAKAQKIIEETIEECLKDSDFRLVETQYSSAPDNRITAYLYKIGGITVDELGKYSKILYPALENIDFLKSGFELEISSPGIFRKFKTKKEFKIFKDFNVDISMIDGAKLKGKIVSSDENSVLIESSERKIQIEFEQIKTVRLSG